jgi:hypothetical protein
MNIGALWFPFVILNSFLLDLFLQAFEETDSFLTAMKYSGILQMSLTVSQVYEVRFGSKLSLPKIVQDNIAKLRITPVFYKPFRPPPQKHVQHRHKQQPQVQIGSSSENWREKTLIEYVSKIKVWDDPDYSEIFGILNKLAPSNLDILSNEIIQLLNKRDEAFRLRVITLLFNKAINESAFASVMSDCSVNLNKIIPEIRDDLQIQIEMFPKLYNMTETLVFPSMEEPGFDDKVVAWMKQKERRRGYSKFMTQLFVRNLISEDIIYASLEGVLYDLNETAKQKKTPQLEENTTHLVDFLFESAKILPTTSTKLRIFIRNSLKELLSIPRPELPSLCMRSRFKAEDTLKCVQ